MVDNNEVFTKNVTKAQSDSPPPFKRAVSLFSNCGVGDFGYRQAGFQFDVMADVDPRRLKVALLNHPEARSIPGDLRYTWRQVVKCYRKIAGREPPALLAACPPCQGMSSAFGDRGHSNDPDTSDERNLLVVVIFKVVRELKPKLVVVENVPEFLTRKVRHPKTKAPVSAAKLLISSLESDYAVFPILTNLAHYGVPQSRNRTFLTFIKRDLKILNELVAQKITPYPPPTHDPTKGGEEPITLQRALDELDLPTLDARTKESAISDIGNGLHFVPVWEDRRYDVVAAIPINSGASAWENKVCEKGHQVDVGDNDAICPECHRPLLRPIVQEEDGTYRLVKGFRSTSYRRMDPNKPAFTITTASGHLGSAYTIHPFENRLFSPLECAYLQTIPKEFDWGDALEKWGHTNVRDMIGEAVPPHFTELHGKKLIALLNGKVLPDLLADEDVRVKRARKKL